MSEAHQASIVLPVDPAGSSWQAQPSTSLVDSPRELLTEDEHEAMRLSAELANVLGRIIGPTCNDTYEMVKDIHAIQRLILSQAGARAYPELYRPLGEAVGSSTSE